MHICRHSILSRRHWVFDLDGTLTVPVHDFAMIRQALGVPDGSDILGFLGELNPAEATPLRERLRQIEMELAVKTRAAEGAVALVEELNSRGVRMGVLTRNTREIALHTLECIGICGYFCEEWVFGRDEAAPKPAPDGIHKLAACWRAEPSDILMVGDYLYDLQTGRAAGVATIHVDPSRLFRWPALADLSVASLADLLPAASPPDQVPL